MNTGAFSWDNFIEGASRAFKDTLPWQINAEEFVRRFLVTGNVSIHPTAVIEEGAVLKGPIFVGPNCFVGAHAYLRGGVYLMGNNSIGPGCELKSAILFPKANLAHFNFVGDSILGSGVNMEAGSIIANHFNERDDKQISVVINGSTRKTGATKFGAVVGDNCKIGANAVLSPGTILPPGTVIARLALVQQSA
jgi:UDP-N-acetylglucosamine diphosphorylase / glucose-1-phosphate thymidylyltransferase / UDP-N-acetylgalactosamine diphosphorylase / glucosamine-1-phosphate N-acetyltransferase / galactosamine-1-phosphate N-acetyltransferase